MSKTVLAIDSSGLSAAVALVRDGKVVAEYQVTNKKTHSQTLLPMIDEICRMGEQDPKELDAIAISSGPGSFTGLRIGSATAKGMALAIGCPIVEVPTLQGLACNLSFADGVVVPMMDARRKQVYTGIYEFEDGVPVPVKDQMAVPVSEVIEYLNSTGKSVWLLGDGALCYEKELREGLTVPYHFAPLHLNSPHGSSYAYLALKLLAGGKTVSAQAHKPDYLRISQAEREREKRLAMEREKQEEGHPGGAQ